MSLAGIPFNAQYQDEMSREMAQAEKRQLIMYAGLALLALVVMAAVVVMVKRRRSEVGLPLEGVEMNVGAFPFESEEPAEIPVKQLTPEEKEQKKVKDQVEKVAKDQPDSVAQLIRTWLAQD
jgi:flagellar M-ring protein FliF